jgi:hypothetical protein
MNIESIGRAVGRLKDAIIPGDPERAERLAYIEKLHNMSDEELNEAWYQENPAARPTASREELIASFMSIDIDAVPESLLKPDEQLGRVNYNNVLINSLERDRVDAGTLEQLQRWHTWKEQNYPSSL